MPCPLHVCSLGTGATLDVARPGSISNSGIVSGVPTASPVPPLSLVELAGALLLPFPICCTHSSKHGAHTSVFICWPGLHHEQLGALLAGARSSSRTSVVNAHLSACRSGCARQTASQWAQQKGAMRLPL